MTKQEILKELKQGKKVTHRYFTENEWIQQRGSFYYDENGYPIHPNEFWFYRTESSFEDGWELYANSSS